MPHLNDLANARRAYVMCMVRDSLIAEKGAPKPSTPEGSRIMARVLYNVIGKRDGFQIMETQEGFHVLLRTNDWALLDPAWAAQEMYPKLVTPGDARYASEEYMEDRVTKRTLNYLLWDIDTLTEGRQ